MALRIVGNETPFGIDIVDQTGGSILSHMMAQRLRVVFDNEGAKLEIDQSIELDFTVSSEVRAYLPCPEMGTRREIDRISFKDGDGISFPRNFSARGDHQCLHKTLP